MMDLTVHCFFSASVSLFPFFFRLFSFASPFVLFLGFLLPLSYCCSPFCFRFPFVSFAHRLSQCIVQGKSGNKIWYIYLACFRRRRIHAKNVLESTKPRDLLRFSFLLLISVLLAHPFIVHCSSVSLFRFASQSPSLSASHESSSSMQLDSANSTTGGNSNANPDLGDEATDKEQGDAGAAGGSDDVFASPNNSRHRDDPFFLDDPELKSKDVCIDYPLHAFPFMVLPHFSSHLLSLFLIFLFLALHLPFLSLLSFSFFYFHPPLCPCLPLLCLCLTDCSRSYPPPHPHIMLLFFLTPFYRFLSSLAVCLCFSPYFCSFRSFSVSLFISSAPACFPLLLYFLFLFSFFLVFSAFCRRFLCLLSILLTVSLISCVFLFL